MERTQPRATSETQTIALDRYEVEASFLTDVGKVRTSNEDSAAVVHPDEPAQLRSKGVLVIVADGMGGHEGGEVASRTATERVADVYYHSDRPPQQALVDAFLAANQEIRDRAKRDKHLTGMGTTCTAVAAINGLVYSAHVGDSRVYLIRGQQAYRMTEDHSAPMALVQKGLLTLAQASHHEDRNVILRAMGTYDKLEVSTWKEPFPLRPGDRMVLCSDGFHDSVADEEIGALASRHNSAPESCRALLDLALQRDGADNITVAVLAVKERSE
ncbi:MAG: PP2C family serine/threonine-protein phosphatase [Bryobacteraceae bacterium]|nr:PP2C family serine/threonine-protein phosphatase [Bryobacteraceae bacterium]